MYYREHPFDVAWQLVNMLNNNAIHLVCSYLICRFCAAFFCYLATMVTVLWILRLRDISKHLQKTAAEGNSSSNATSTVSGPQALQSNESTEPRTFFSKLSGSTEVWFFQNVLNVLTACYWRYSGLWNIPSLTCPP